MPKRRLFILFDGFEQTRPATSDGCQIVSVPRDATVQPEKQNPAP